MIAVPLVTACVLSYFLIIRPATARPRRAKPVESAVENESPYKESPILRQRVERGELPPVQERLPDEPLVVHPPAIGRYQTDPKP
jgi:hypothetical protein